MPLFCSIRGAWKVPLMKKGVVLSSGGIDSTTTLAMADGYEVYSLSFNYGQRIRMWDMRANRLIFGLHRNRTKVFLDDVKPGGQGAKRATYCSLKTCFDYPKFTAIF
jgi:hypothetical protein